MKEYDVVKLVKDFEDLKKGTIGAIVHDYNGKVFEVEFIDQNKDTIGVYTTPIEYLELVISYNKK